MSSSSKRSKTKSIINPSFFTQVEESRIKFQQGKPYPHLVFHDFLHHNVASLVHDEVGKLQGTLKETDLFRVYQTGDLANADDADIEHQQLIPQLLNLRHVINSPDFRTTVEEITGCGPLSNQVDLSANVYANGCHLLCHDDVIGTRKISYIIYVGDPEDIWQAEDGGRLQLYESDPDNHVPLAEPYDAIPPTFNSLALFVVEPGVSFHAVEEVFATNKARCSLQGWFHAAPLPPSPQPVTSTTVTLPPHVATLQHLLHSGGLHLPLLPAVALNDVSPTQQDRLSATDIQQLESWINPLFLKPEYISRIAAKCESEDGCVSLVQFLKTDVQDRLKACLFPSRKAKVANTPGWQVVGPAHVQRFLRLQDNHVNDAAQEQLAWLNTQMSLPSFTRYIQLLTSLSLKCRRSCVRCFRAGSDYTVAYAHDEPTALDVTLCFVDDFSDPSHADVWASGDAGGFEMYLEKEDDGVGDVAVYARDQEAPGVVCIDPAFAVLSIVDRDPSRMRYIKYIVKDAPSDRFDIASTYEFVLEDEVGKDDA